MEFRRAYGPFEAMMLGVELEEAGRRFYERAAKSCADYKVKNLFEELARAEIKHKKVIREEIETLYAPDWYREEDHQMLADYLESVQGQEIFPDPEDETACDKAASDALQALEIGIRAEKQSIDYYAFLRDMTQDKKGREVFERLRKEEVGHLEMLEGMREYL
jgi:rubrerythrin